MFDFERIEEFQAHHLPNRNQFFLGDLGAIGKKIIFVAQI